MSRIPLAFAFPALILATACVNTQKGENDDTAGTSDNAGGDSGDSAADSGGDSGSDSGSDSGADSGGDSGGDSGSDSGGDSGSDSGGDSGGDSGSDSGGDSGSDSGADSGGDSGDSGTTEEAPCGPFNHVGRIGAITEWMYYLGGGRVSEETGWDATTGQVLSESDDERHAADYTEYAHVWWEHRCDAEGLWAVHSYSEWTREYNDGHSTAGWTDITFEDVLMAPPTMSVGTAWSSDGVQTTTEEEDGVTTGPTSAEASSSVTVTALEDVTVTAGTYSSYVVEGYANGRWVTTYLNDEVGSVKNAGGELVSFTP